MTTVLLAGGGTGGHVYPLIAVADALRQREPGLGIVFVGTERGIERDVVPARGYTLELVHVEPIRGRSVGGLLRGVSRAVASIPESLKLLRRIQPDAVVTVGGYAAGPVSAMARVTGVPLALLEPNAVMGLSNRLMAPWVDRAYTAFPEAERHFRASRVLRAGVPIRVGFAPAPWHAEPRTPRVLILGGSQGARSLNENVPAALAGLGRPVSVRHQCGRADVDAVRQRYFDKGIKDAEVTAFIDDMPSALCEADLVISRAGASAVSEICAVGRASLLLPYPFAAGNHQEQNARSLAAAGAAALVRNSDASPSRLTEEIAALLEDPKRMESMADQARSIGRPEAATRIAESILELVRARGSSQTHARQSKETL